MNNKYLTGVVERQRLISFVKEIFRKTIHICSCFVPLFLKIAYLPTIILLVCALLFYTLCEILRLKGKNIPLISKITEIASRKRDENKFVLGPVTLVCGILIVALLLPLDYAKVGIYALSFGDGLASLVGRLFGKITIPGSKGKTVAGSLACFCAVMISTYVVSGNCIISLLIGTAAMLIEVMPLADFDNILIPVAIGYLYLFIS